MRELELKQDKANEDIATDYTETQKIFASETLCFRFVLCSGFNAPQNYVKYKSATQGTMPKDLQKGS
jgi:hypothetical protein